VTPTASTVSERPPASAPAGVPVVTPRTPASLIPARGRRARSERSEPRSRKRTARRDWTHVVRAYVALTKPRIVELLLVTTAPTMMLAYGGLPPVLLLVAVLVGGSLAAGAANALNCYLDRDIDQVMRRTSRRPLPTHTVSPRAALVFGLVLAGLSVVVMATFTNALATVLTVAAIGYYDIVYTMWLKRTTPQNTVWGGVCGAMPVLIGWAAVTGSLSAAAWVLFAVVFLWQPPHFYALAIRFSDDYARARIPMLPVVATPTRVGAESVAYAWLTLVASLALVWPLGAGPVYGGTALVTGGLFVREAHRLYGRARRGEALRPMRLFHWSITYLTILFVAVAVEAFR